MLYNSTQTDFYIDDDDVSNFTDDNGETVIIADVEGLSTILYLNDPVLDGGLTVLTAATHVELCTNQPTSYANVTSYALGSAPLSFAAPAAVSGGRKAVSSVPSAITIMTAGTARWWAASDHAGSRLLATGPFNTEVITGVSDVWSLPAFEIKLPS